MKTISTFLIILIFIFSCQILSLGTTNTLYGRVDNRREIDGTFISLDGKFYSNVQSNGQFQLKNIPDGQFTLKVESIYFRYPLIRVEVLNGHIVLRQIQPGTEFIIARNQKLPSLPQPLVLTPLNQEPLEYLTSRSGFNLFSILSSPMVIMMLVSGGLMFFMPKMMENMDEDQLKEMRQSQDAMKGLMSGQTSLSGLINQLSQDQPDSQQQQTVTKKK